MPLTSKNHRQIHCILLAINVIGLTLLSIAIVSTYSSKKYVKSGNLTDDEVLRTKFDNFERNEGEIISSTPNKNDVCPQYFPLKIEAQSDEYGEYFTVNGLVSVSHSETNKFICLGVLIRPSVVLVSYKCASLIKDSNDVYVRLYNESGEYLFQNTDEETRKLKNQIVSPSNELALLILDKSYGDEIELFELPIDYAKCDEDEESDRDATALWFDKKLFKSQVKIIPQFDCALNYGDDMDLSNYFCTLNSDRPFNENIFSDEEDEEYEYEESKEKMYPPRALVLNTITYSNGATKRVITGIFHKGDGSIFLNTELYTKVSKFTKWIEDSIEGIP